MVSTKNYKEMHSDALKAEAFTLRKNIADLRFALAAGRQIDTSARGKAKKELARVLTVLNGQRINN